jgi:putative transposase
VVLVEATRRGALLVIREAHKSHGMRESHEDWLALGRDLIARGLGAPLLIVAYGAPGLIKVVEHCWPASDRQHCAVHRVRNLLAKPPERVRRAYWQALDDGNDERNGKQRLQALVDQLDGAGLHRRRQMPGRRPRRARRSPALPDKTPPQVALGKPARTITRRSERAHQGDRPFPGETSCLTLVWAVLDLYITHAKNASASANSTANPYAESDTQEANHPPTRR